MPYAHIGINEWKFFQKNPGVHTHDESRVQYVCRNRGESIVRESLHPYHIKPDTQQSRLQHHTQNLYLQQLSSLPQWDWLGNKNKTDRA